MNKQFVAIVIVVILGLFGVFYFTKDSAEAPANGANNSSSSSSEGSNNTIGDNTKKVVLLEYGDFQCPACGAYHPIVKQVIEKYNKDILFQFKNFPLQQIHPNARAAARAAEAAGKQDKYWEMHDLLYEQQQTWEQSTAVNSIFESYAKQLNLDVAKFKTDFASETVNDVINADFSAGTKAGVNSTPTFFLQGKKLEEPPQDLEGFSKIIDQAIKEANTSNN